MIHILAAVAEQSHLAEPVLVEGRSNCTSPQLTGKWSNIGQSAVARGEIHQCL
jgi:hypothetical protein